MSNIMNFSFQVQQKVNSRIYSGAFTVLSKKKYKLLLTLSAGCTNADKCFISPQILSTEKLSEALAKTKYFQIGWFSNSKPC